MSIGKVATTADKITPKTPTALRVVFGKPAGNESGLNIATINADDYITKQMFLDNTSNAPIALLGISSNTVQSTYTGDYIREIFVIAQSGSPSINIGLSSGDGYFLPTTPVGVFQQVTSQYYFAADGDLYFNISGGGGVNIYIIYYNFS